MSLPPPTITVHLLHDNTLTSDNHNKFLALAKHYEQEIKFYNVEKICPKDIDFIKKLFMNYPNFKRFSIAAIYRLLIPQIIPTDIEKVIYLDSDIIVNLDINELWQINLLDKPIASDPVINKRNIEVSLCKDGFVNDEDYFCSGVMVMNLKQIRQNEMENLVAGILFLAENFKYDCFDQEILNYCFSKNYVKLPIKFDFYVRDARYRGEFSTENRILHYLAQSLSCDMNDNFNRLWFEYFAKTPWFTKDVIANIFAEFKNIMNQREYELKNLSVKLTTLVAEKSRAFVAPLEHINDMKKFFDVKDTEDVIPIINQESFKRLIQAMLESKGRKVFFILFDKYNKLSATLIKLGFVEDKDFINASKLLPRNIFWNTHHLVKAL